MKRNTKIGAAALVVIAFLGGVGFLSTSGTAIPRIEIVNTAVIATPTASASLSGLEPIELATPTPEPETTETTQPTETTTPLPTKPATPSPTSTATRIPASPTVAPTSSVTQPARVNGLLKVFFFDVGQGDSALIQTPDGHNVLIDAGESGSGALAYLKSQGVQTLDLVVVSHPHSDHIGGLPEIIRALPVAQVAASGQPHTTNDYSRLLDAIMVAKAKYTEVKRGDKLQVGNLTFEVLSPAKTQPTGDLNNNSVVLRLVYGQTSFLFEGDAQADAENGMLAAGVTQPVTVLKVAHHGSRSSSTPAFLSVIKPQIAVYSAGAGNSYGHPHAQTIAALKAVGADIHGTDQEGSIVITSDGSTVRLANGKVAAPRGPPPVGPVVVPTQGQQSVAPTAQPTVAPVVVPVAPLSGLTLEILSVTSPARPGGRAMLTARATPGANCGITVYYKSGPSKAQGLGPMTAGGDGSCSWTWSVGTNTTPGTWRIVVSANSGGQNVSKETQFTVAK